jgi:phosphoglycerol transferase
VFGARRYFGDVTFDQLLFVMMLDMGGAFKADTSLIIRFSVLCLLLPITATLVALNIKVIIKHLTTMIIIIKRYCLQWRIHHFFNYLHIILFLTGMFILYRTFHLHEFISNSFIRASTDYYETQYKAPGKLLLKPHVQPSNLLVIYVESLEKTYAQREVFKDNLLRSLQEEESRGFSFEHYSQLPGTGWTTAGIISTQCGVPLKLTTNQQSANLATFMPNVRCLSDILADAGYYNVFVKGASLRFAGMRTFLQSHHIHEMYGKEEWMQSGYTPNQLSWWGLYDEDLYRETKKILRRLNKQAQPYSLTMLTVDLHGPDGFVTPFCHQLGARDFTGIVGCQAELLHQFLLDIEKEGLLKNTNVVVMGDHLAMKNPLSKKLSQAKERVIYNLVMPVHPMKQLTQHVVHFSWLPTILALLQFDLPHDYHVGLAVSGVATVDDHDAVTRLANIDFDVMREKVLQPSKQYQAMWRV